ncbi:hypothetical protein PL321_08940 [Caloramator sp. mosi_1]|nr:hypothetical protein [Caloramator sp. mosi_1]WDC85433.1 hypothetical protein PL321_08940 [Caloramator sp. mosi_1]
MDKFYTNNTNIKFVSCPYVYWDLTTKRYSQWNILMGLKLIILKPYLMKDMTWMI